VILADVGCCGRSLISTGLLREARDEVARASGALAELLSSTGAEAVLVLEPSCASAIRDDWLELLPEGDPPGVRASRVALAAKTFLVEEFLDAAWDAHPKRPEVPTQADALVLHGHCHQKALWSNESSARFLRRIFGRNVTVLDTGCCGMAGSFGYVDRRYDLSMAIGEERLPEKRWCARPEQVADTRFTMARAARRSTRWMLPCAHSGSDWAFC
jgi:Fe-S oxidoreductase